MTADPDSGERLTTILDAARRLACSRSTVYRLIDAGELARVKVGRGARIPESSLYAYVARQTTASAPTTAGR